MLWDFVGSDGIFNQPEKEDVQHSSTNILILGRHVQPRKFFSGGVRFLRLVAVLLGGGCFVAPQLSGQPRRKDVQDPTGLKS